MAKVLLINGSSNEEGCTYTALCEVAGALEKEGVETEIIQLGKEAIRDCIGCGSCGKLGHCVFDDDMVNEVRKKQKRQTDLCLEHRYIMDIPAGGFCPSWIVCSIPAARHLRLNRAL